MGEIDGGRSSGEGGEVVVTAEDGGGDEWMRVSAAAIGGIHNLFIGYGKLRNQQFKRERMRNEESAWES